MISKTVFLKKVFARKTPKTPRVYQGLRRRIEKHRTPEGDGNQEEKIMEKTANALRNTEPRKGTETRHRFLEHTGKCVEKHRTPEGDGNSMCLIHSANDSFEKHRTPEGDGNNSRTSLTRIFPVLRNTEPRKGTETIFCSVCIFKILLRNTEPRKGTETVLFHDNQIHDH